MLPRARFGFGDTNVQGTRAARRAWPSSLGQSVGFDGRSKPSIVAGGSTSSAGAAVMGALNEACPAGAAAAGFFLSLTSTSGASSEYFCLAASSSAFHMSASFFMTAWLFSCVESSGASASTAARAASRCWALW